jgi:hypothetical protein
MVEKDRHALYASFAEALRKERSIKLPAGVKGLRQRGVFIFDKVN